MVREEGLEPSILTAQNFKSCVYTNSTTLALSYSLRELLITVNHYFITNWIKSQCKEDFYVSL